ncbi:SLBB domain-containing protein [Anthocerotibacter panamensis]|uniref:SLBB domain-containing protein n=1 Tax=Anthocerotibacter panamensis TaxID=2857077 RepID=UPI001C4084F4|nr:SLBB domain-containing protein [Anthocerotibacter panamensis]
MLKVRIAVFGILLLAMNPSRAEPPVDHPPSFNLRTSSSSPYLLGPGDTLEVTVANIPELSVSGRLILPDGTVNLPLVGAIPVAGLSQNELADRLQQLWSPYIEPTTIAVGVIGLRPIAVTLQGEVNRPGPYSLNQTNSLNNTNLGTGKGVTGGNGGGRLTVSQALSIAGGVTEGADIENITLIRKQADGQKERLSVNLWAMLQGEDTSQDRFLLDGDLVVVPRAQPDKANYNPLVVASSTLAPSSVEIKVLGEVNRPGLVSVTPSAPFTDALVAAGGLTNDADPQAVQLLRLNPDGSVARFVLPANLEQGRDPTKNPSLHKGDLIVVSRSFGASLLKGVQQVISNLSPFLFLNNLFGGGR